MIWKTGTALLPRVLAIPVFTLSEKTWEILFSCSGFARTTIRMFHRVWIATWMSSDYKKHLSTYVELSVLPYQSHSLVWSWYLWCFSGRLSLYLPILCHSKGPPETQWHKYHVRCDLRCHLVSCLGPYTETRSWCCGEDQHFLWGDEEVCVVNIINPALIWNVFKHMTC